LRNEVALGKFLSSLIASHFILPLLWLFRQYDFSETSYCCEKFYEYEKFSFGV